MKKKGQEEEWKRDKRERERIAGRERESEEDIKNILDNKLVKGIQHSQICHTRVY